MERTLKNKRSTIFILSFNLLFQYIIILIVALNKRHGLIHLKISQILYKVDKKVTQVKIHKQPKGRC